MKFYFWIIICVLITACRSKAFIPRQGDLLFCVAEQSAYSNAIIDATAQHEPLKFDHVAIVIYYSGIPYVIEASSKKGVIKSTLEQFLSSATDINGKPGVVVKRINTYFPLTQMVTNAESHLGEAYDWSYKPDNGKMYCSELIYVCYNDSLGMPLFEAKPMNFRDINGKIPQFWINLFQSLGEDIPEGVSGTNPNDISKSSILTEVYRYFQ